MQIVSTGDNLHEMSNLVSWEKYKKIFQNVSRKFYQECKALNKSTENIVLVSTEHKMIYIITHLYVHFTFICLMLSSLGENFSR